MCVALGTLDSPLVVTKQKHVHLEERLAWVDALTCCAHGV